jgi:DUF971 family protein
MAEPVELRPLSLRKEGDDRLVIEWSDGHRGVYSWQHLRKHCPCASCREGGQKPPDPFHVLSAKELAAPNVLRPTVFAPVGAYGYKITWNDGHDTGIYTLEYLRGLCQCDSCERKV